MENKIGLLMLTILTISILAVLPISIRADGNPATLGLSADKGFYVYHDPDDWIKESWVVTDTEFTLYVYARNWPASNVYLAIAVNNTEGIVSIEVGSDTLHASNFILGTVQWPYEAGGGEIPSHGIYPTYYALVKFGDVNSIYSENLYRASVNVKISASTPVKIHFDAQGIIASGPKTGSTCFCPFSHDLTYIPSYIPPEQISSISIEKSANVTMAHVGDCIKYTYKVYNTGNVPLSNVHVEDSLGITVSYVSGDVDGDGLLDTDETWIFEAEYVVPEDAPDKLINTASATGVDPLGREVSDSDSWTVDILHPGIDVIKWANATMIHEGDWVKYNVTVVNTGDCDLKVTLFDEKLSISWTGTLKPGEKHEAIVSIQPTVDPTENTASATGVDPLGREVSDSDSWTVDIINLVPGYGGRTLGYWANAGNKLINNDDLNHLNSLSYLYKYTFTVFRGKRLDQKTIPRFDSSEDVKIYLLSANAKEMKFMLSAQLIATLLNVRHSYLSNSTIIYINSNGNGQFMSIKEIIDNAYQALCSGDRATQGYWKGILDMLNNNELYFVK